MLTDPAFVESVKAQVPGRENLTYRLRPPILKALGRKTKIAMRPRTHFALRLLAKGRFVRGTLLDPFGHTHMRRIERRLIAHYEATMRYLVPALTAESYDRAVAVAAAPDLVRGCEEVKLNNLWRYVARLSELGID